MSRVECTLTNPQDPRIGEYGGWLGASYALMQFLFAPFWGRLSDRVGRKPILIGSLVGDAVFYTLFGLSAHNIYGQFAARILAGIFSSASLAVAQAYAADITPPHLRAMGMGYIGAAFGFGFVIGPAVGGLIGAGPPGLAAVLFGPARAGEPRLHRALPARAGARAQAAGSASATADVAAGPDDAGRARPDGISVPADIRRDIRLRQPGRHIHGLPEAALPLRQQHRRGRLRLRLHRRPDRHHSRAF